MSLSDIQRAKKRFLYGLDPRTSIAWLYFHRFA